jgi:hypothetical protein
MRAAAVERNLRLDIHPGGEGSVIFQRQRGLVVTLMPLRARLGIGDRGAVRHGLHNDARVVTRDLDEIGAKRATESAGLARLQPIGLLAREPHVGRVDHGRVDHGGRVR